MSESDRLFAMFHRSTAPSNKEHVLQEFTKTDSKLRTVFATVAFGMGVDVPDIDFVVHWGAPRGSSLKWLFIITHRQVEDLQNSLISFDDRSFVMSRPV
jgi:superfamily II DNA/RNA helicase